MGLQTMLKEMGVEVGVVVISIDSSSAEKVCVKARFGKDASHRSEGPVAPRSNLL